MHTPSTRTIASRITLAIALVSLAACADGSPTGTAERRIASPRRRQRRGSGKRRDRQLGPDDHRTDTPQRRAVQQCQGQGEVFQSRRRARTRDRSGEHSGRHLRLLRARWRSHRYRYGERAPRSRTESEFRPRCQRADVGRRQECQRPDDGWRGDRQRHLLNSSDPAVRRTRASGGPCPPGVRRARRLHRTTGSLAVRRRGDRFGRTATIHAPARMFEDANRSPECASPSP